MRKNQIIIIFLIFFNIILTSNYSENQIIVKVDKSITNDIMKKDLVMLGFEIETKLFNYLNIFLIKYDSIIHSDINSAINIIQSLSYVIYAQKNHLISERLIPNDPQYSNMWHLNNTGQGGGTENADIDAPEAWDISTGNNRNIVIGVVDSGFDIEHQDLNENIWTNINEIENEIDDDENGYVDDINGWDAYEQDFTHPVTSHGTKVAGMIGAKGNNNLDVVGVNWNTKIMPISGSSSLTSTVIASYSYAYDNKILWIDTDGVLGANVVVINSSWGINYGDCNSGEFPVWNDMFDTLGEVGILSVAATMNINANVDEQGDVPTSCASDYLITVTNTDRNDSKFSSAAYGAESIDLGAPGTSVCSIRPGNLTSCSLTGTSYSAPIVSGAIGLMYDSASDFLYQEYLQNPSSTPLIIKNLILNTVDLISSLNGITVSSGRLNLFNAVSAANQYDGSCIVVGDFNADSYANIQDIILVMNCILSGCNDDEIICMDLNDDFQIDIFDIIVLVSIVINRS